MGLSVKLKFKQLNFFGADYKKLKPKLTNDKHKNKIEQRCLVTKTVRFNVSSHVKSIIATENYIFCIKRQT